MTVLSQAAPCFNKLSCQLNTPVPLLQFHSFLKTTAHSLAKKKNKNGMSNKKIMDRYEYFRPLSQLCYPFA